MTVIVTKNDFLNWMTRMGLNQKQTYHGAKLIGIMGQTSASHTVTGKRDLKQVERLAMSALRLGLKPWSPEYDSQLERMALVFSSTSGADKTADLCNPSEGQQCLEPSTASQ